MCTSGNPSRAHVGASRWGSLELPGSTLRPTWKSICPNIFQSTSSFLRRWRRVVDGSRLHSLLRKHYVRTANVPWHLVVTHSILITHTSRNRPLVFGFRSCNAGWSRDRANFRRPGADAALFKVACCRASSGSSGVGELPEISSTGVFLARGRPMRTPGCPTIEAVGHSAPRIRVQLVPAGSR